MPAWALLPIAGALAAILLPASPAAADELQFTPPQFLPGDAAIGSAAGMQVEADIALGGDTYLAVWSDGRSTPNDFYPFATEGSGTDIYGVRLDSDGNLLDSTPFVIDQRFGDQVEPRVAWNGQNWLVLWRQEVVALPTYEELRAVRVDPSGNVLDDPPILIANDSSFYSDHVVEGGDGNWLVLTLANGPTDGVLAFRVGADGAVLNPGGLLIHGTNFLLDFDLAFAGDEYLIVWSGSFDPAQAARYTPDLQLIGTSILPFADRVTTDGNDFLVAWASGSPPAATIRAVRVEHGGGVGTPFILFTGGNQDGTCCADVTWDGTYYWVSWGGPRLARVTADGSVVDPGGIITIPPTTPISTPRFERSPAGGLQLVFNHGVNGAVYPKDVFVARVPAPGQVENETLVSTSAPAQVDADFAEGDGTHLIVFRSRWSDGGRILAQRIDASGTALDPEPIEVAPGPIPGEGVPSLGGAAVAWNGAVFLITWSDGIQILARRMLPDGTLLDPAPLSVMDGWDPDVAALGQIFLVVGLDYLLDNPQWQATHSMRVDGATGENLDAAPNPLGGVVIFARHPHVVRWGGRWLAVWQTNISHDNPVASTKAAFVDADGTTPGVISVPLAWRPNVAVSENVALIVAVTNSIASATTDMAGILMAEDGTFPGSSFVVSAAEYKQLRPAADWNGSEFIAVWEDKRNAEIYYDQRTDIYGTRIDASGTVLDPAGVPIASAAVPEVQPALLSIGATTLLAISTLRPESPLGALRIGIQVDGAAPGSIPEGPSATGPGIRLLGARPNPGRPGTTIRFETEFRGPISLRLFNVNGRLIRTLIDGEVFGAAVSVELAWDGRDSAGEPAGTGVYYYKVETARGSVGDRLILIE